MIEIRASAGVESTVWISRLKLRLPSCHGWVTLPTNYWTGDSEGSSDLYDAFDRGLIEVRVKGQRAYPDWYLNVIAPNVKVPEECLSGEESDVLAFLSKLREDAHSAVWAILRREIYAREMSGADREQVISFLQSESGI